MQPFKIYYPVKPNVINQAFGGNGAYYQAEGVNVIGHNGIDFQSYHGQPVYAAHDGTAYTEVDENQGHGVVIVTNEQFDYNGVPTYFKTIYWHFTQENQPNIWGKKVKAGDLIGYADSTGLSTGDHLHFGVKPVANNEPAFSWVNTQQNNGYMGAIDPAPFFNGLYAQDINNPSVTPPYQFNVTMVYGNQSHDVAALQQKLKDLGFFPAAQACTGFYGPKTAAAVLAFQLKHAVDSVDVLNGLAGKSCGPKTRAALNVI